MVLGPSSSLCWMFLSVYVTVSVSDDVLNITAKPGDTVILPCQAPRNTPVRAVVWIRPDLNDLTVCVYRGRQCEKDDQSPFQGRVEINDDWVKNGNMSLILKNVTINDSGTYECHVIQSESKRKRRDSHLDDAYLIKPKIQLTVRDSGGGAGRTEEGGDKDGGDKDGNNSGHVGLAVGLTVAAAASVAVAVVVGFLIYRKRGKEEPL
ncbi:hypothetical protein Q5P01_000077 [Channa striata]|uniref:Ig-like domain-containing protein n=1 Tax=Channa striata TaxID=64152 RepID=A0AA88IHH3_CHASR|nr:hypothetical protein Q5P01_000077 [Channa striata]